jgi:FMN phosphatase YigB (HAD superfamily)
VNAPAAVRWPAVRGVLFDVDGTLYDQRALRAWMAIEWGRYALRHGPRAFEVSKAILAFRRAREELRARGQGAARLQDVQYAEAAGAAGMDEARLRDVVEEWIFQRPLRHLPRCGRPGAAELFRRLREGRRQVGVVSDYPAGAKLRALGLADLVTVEVCTTDAEVNAFKPHPAGLTHACRAWALPPAEVLYVGDREDVDAAAAAAIGMPCLIVGRSSSFHALTSALDV